MSPVKSPADPPRFTRLQDWLDWQEKLHHKTVDLGLERVGTVADALDLRQTVATTITIAGNNGKGTVAHVLSALLQAAGLRVGRYTSPHLLRYNERVAIDDLPCSDAELCRAFAAIDAARGSIPLSFFEFGTLAALWCFRAAAAEVQ
jgi:dihydrofolate synthase/folylpolyglutamate synthase